MGNRTKVVNESRAEEILTAWANFMHRAEDDQRAWERLASRWPEVFRDPVGRHVAGDDIGGFVRIRNRLREAWDEHDQRAREWYVYKVRDLYARAVRVAEIDRPNLPPEGQTVSEAENERVPSPAGRRLARLLAFEMGDDSPPPPLPFEDVMYHFQRRLRYALHCANPLCPAPYFFKQEGVRTQRYCSPDCAHTARLESKGRWWNEVGKARRESARTGGTQHGRRGKK